MAPFLGSFTGSRSFGGFGGGGDLGPWIQSNGFTLYSGTAGDPNAVYERTFTTSGTTSSNYSLTAAPIPAKMQLLVVAGGSGSTAGLNGGGGAGGVLYHPSYIISTVSATGITVGGGTPGGSSWNTNIGDRGGNSVFGEITVYGGGKGGVWSSGNGYTGGSGGGSNGHWSPSYNSYNGGAALAPDDGGSGKLSGSTHYGNRGGNKNNSYYYVSPGGGGAGGNGSANGGNGVTLMGRTVGGGGGGGTHAGWGYYPTSNGGSGGGGRGTQWYWGRGTAGTDGTGGGGGTGHHSPEYSGGRGGCGIIVARIRGDGQQI